ncbi:MAG: MAPEG family protein [Nannocystis sp.]|nr:MAPEG family protein [Nannocystis sp.]MBA3548268.1 MAPEG family protein [Nannocystis sp.]
MTIELTLLGYTLVLALVYIMAAAQARTKQYGTTWNTGARDEAMPPLRPLPARLVRAQANLFETLPLFAAAVLAVVVAGRTGVLSEVGAWMYLLGRLVYLPLYALGVPVVRTVVWMIACVGLVLVLWQLLCG